MISPELTAIEKRLREAAARRAYNEIPSLAACVGAAAAEEAKSLPSGDPLLLEIGLWLQALYRDIEILVRIGRATDAGELRRVAFLRKYLPRGTGEVRRIHLQL